MHNSHSLFLSDIALHVSGVTTTHPQEHKATASTASGNHYTVLLSAAIVKKLELTKLPLPLPFTSHVQHKGK
jgi:hypothetical protein